MVIGNTNGKTLGIKTMIKYYKKFHSRNDEDTYWTFYKQDVKSQKVWILWGNDWKLLSTPTLPGFTTDDVEQTTIQFINEIQLEQKMRTHLT